MNTDPPCRIWLQQGGLIMVGTYSVYLGDKSVGTAQIRRQGLYYCISVRCKLPGDTMYQVDLQCDTQIEKLGVMIPMKDGFGLDTRIPAKKLGRGEPMFSVQPRHGSMPGKYIPLSPEEPFRYLSRLKQSYLERRNGKVGIILKEPGHERS